MGAMRTKPYDIRTPGRGDAGEVEIVLPPPASVIFWKQHGFPDPSIRWHHHEDIEFHLIREGPGTMLVGDAMVPFTAGQVTLIGSNIPHMWLSNLDTVDAFPNRDVFCQVRPHVFEELLADVPDVAGIASVLRSSRRVISLTGGAAADAAGILVKMGTHEGLRRFIDVLDLLDVFVCAPQEERGTILLHDYEFPGDGADGGAGVSGVRDSDDGRINRVLDFMARHLTDGTLNLDSAADVAGMGPTRFSRYFHETAGRTFSEFTRRLRISLACQLLSTTDVPIADVPGLCGYNNASNFNRRFRQETGMTPSEYRRRMVRDYVA